MKINLNEIYDYLEAWRDERKITPQSQKDGYIINIMEELGELSQALRDYEKIKNGERVLRAGIFDIKSTLGEMIIFEGTTKGEIEITLEKAEHEIIDALCDIAILTINAVTDIPCELKHTEIEWKKSSLNADYILKQLVEKCAKFSYFEWVEPLTFNIILINCAYLCEHYGYNFELAMLETIKEISSRTGYYNEATKKWEKDLSDEAKAKWYKADYEKARIKQ